jgi:isopenicillin-N N-acyltransferase-like protein
VTDALVCDLDRGEPGIPYHLVLRGILDAENISDALAVAQRGSRSSSANYLVAAADGLAVDIEAVPGDFSAMHLVFPSDGLLLHTNHFLARTFDRKDVSLWVMPDSPFRLERVRSRVGEANGALTIEDFQSFLADHANHPSGICCHPDTRSDRFDQGATVASMLMDLHAKRMWLADGNPCTSLYRELDYAGFLSKPSPIATHDPCPTG